MDKNEINQLIDETDEPVPAQNDWNAYTESLYELACQDLDEMWRGLKWER